MRRCVLWVGCWVIVVTAVSGCGGELHETHASPGDEVTLGLGGSAAEIDVESGGEGESQAPQLHPGSGIVTPMTDGAFDVETGILPGAASVDFKEVSAVGGESEWLETLRALEASTESAETDSSEVPWAVSWALDPAGCLDDCQVDCELNFDSQECALFCVGACELLCEQGCQTECTSCCLADCEESVEPGKCGAFCEAVCEPKCLEECVIDADALESAEAVYSDSDNECAGSFLSDDELFDPEQGCHSQCNDLCDVSCEAHLDARLCENKCNYACVYTCQDWQELQLSCDDQEDADRSDSSDE